VRLVLPDLRFFTAAGVRGLASKAEDLLLVAAFRVHRGYTDSPVMDCTGSSITSPNSAHNKPKIAHFLPSNCSALCGDVMVAQPCRTWGLPPSADYRMISLPPPGRQVPGTGLNCSETVFHNEWALHFSPTDFVDFLHSSRGSDRGPAPDLTSGHDSLAPRGPLRSRSAPPPPFPHSSSSFALHRWRAGSVRRAALTKSSDTCDMRHKAQPPL
jgi:hypothetical protein